MKKSEETLEFSRQLTINNSKYFSANADISLKVEQKECLNKEKKSIIQKILQNINSNGDFKRILIFLILNIGLMIIEFLVGFITNSIGLISDAGHLFFDIASLIISLIASYISKWPRNSSFTYGYGRAETVAAFVNSLLLIFLTIRILEESIPRILNPPNVDSVNLLVTTSILGLMINIIGLIFFHDVSHSHSHSHSSSCSHLHSHSYHHVDDLHPHSKPSHSNHSTCDINSLTSFYSHTDSHFNTNDSQMDKISHIENKKNKETEILIDLHKKSVKNKNEENKKIDDNLYAIYLHILADALGSIAVIISSLLIKYKNWNISDPICSIVISILILFHVIPLLKRTGYQLLQHVPFGLEKKINKTLIQIKNLPQVKEIIKSNFWKHSSELNVGTLHIYVTNDCNEKKIVQKITNIMKDNAEINYLTVQIDHNITKSEIQSIQHI